MLTRNDTCFFALAFYRQTRHECIRAFEQGNLPYALVLAHQTNYWWQSYLQRRAESRLR